MNPAELASSIIMALAGSAITFLALLIVEAARAPKRRVQADLDKTNSRIARLESEIARLKSRAK